MVHHVIKNRKKATKSRTGEEVEVSRGRASEEEREMSGAGRVTGDKRR